jgi:hypothetical protein
MKMKQFITQTERKEYELTEEEVAAILYAHFKLSEDEKPVIEIGQFSQCFIVIRAEKTTEIPS